MQKRTTRFGGHRHTGRSAYDVAGKAIANQSEASFNVQPSQAQLTMSASLSSVPSDLHHPPINDATKLIEQHVLSPMDLMQVLRARIKALDPQRANGLPVRLHIAGRPCDEATVARIGHAYDGAARGAGATRC